MRLFLFGMVLCSLLTVHAKAADQTPPVNLTGSWSFIWDNDGKNTNPGVLKHEAGVITGTYMNDSKEKCAVAGRMTSAAGVTLMIVCPNWDIKCDGSVDTPRSVAGNYSAYGDSTGSFQMSKQPDKR